MTPATKGFSKSIIASTADRSEAVAADAALRSSSGEGSSPLTELKSMSAMLVDEEDEVVCEYSGVESEESGAI